MNKKILVTGAAGQLGKTIEELYKENDLKIEFVFFDKSNFDITNKPQIDKILKQQKFDYCINCAAYTNVEQAEKTPKVAYKINDEGVYNLAKACKDTNTVLIHVSTDYVFDGQKTDPYNESDVTNPINEYGASKLKGEDNIIKILEKYFIVRTSWLYSNYGTNFKKTIIGLAEINNEIKVVSDQIGSPTNARDLARFLIKIIITNSDKHGIYHYSNEGAISRYEFAKEICQLTKINTTITPSLSKNYKTIAVRPKYSVLCHKKSKEQYNLEIPKWKESLNQ